MNKYQVRNHETGYVIATFDNFFDAKAALQEYEREDLNDGCFEPDFYEVYNTDTENFWCSGLAGSPEDEM